MIETDGYMINGDDTHWIVECPMCHQKLKCKGYFGDYDDVNCDCGCVFKIKKIWIDNLIFIGRK